MLWLASGKDLREFFTAKTPPLTFTSNRRVGAKGAHIVGIDLEKRQLLLPFTWIELQETSEAAPQTSEGYSVV